MKKFNNTVKNIVKAAMVAFYIVSTIMLTLALWTDCLDSQISTAHRVVDGLQKGGHIIWNEQVTETLSREYAIDAPIVIDVELDGNTLGNAAHGVIFIDVDKIQRKKGDAPFQFTLEGVLRHEWRHIWQEEKFPKEHGYWSAVESSLGDESFVNGEANPFYWGNPIEVDARAFAVGVDKGGEILQSVEISDDLTESEVDLRSLDFEYDYTTKLTHMVDD